MTKSLRCLDLFCKAGGAAMGYYRGGFEEIVGVDIQPQPHFPFSFFMEDALVVLKSIPFLRSFDLIHASPPCQGYSWSAQRWEHHRTQTPKLVEMVRSLLKEASVPYVIENVIGAPLISPVTLDGLMFQANPTVESPGVIRRRLFETNWPLPQPHRRMPIKGGVKKGVYVTVAGHGGDGRASLRLWKTAMGIDWMTKEELAEAIPPSYTEYIAKEFVKWRTSNALAI